VALSSVVGPTYVFLGNLDPSLKKVHYSLGKVLFSPNNLGPFLAKIHYSLGKLFFSLGKFFYSL